MKNNERAKRLSSNHYSGFKTIDKEHFYDGIVVKLLTLLQGRIMDIMLGKAGILIDQKFGAKFLKLCRLIEAMELERDPNGKLTSVTTSVTPLKSAVAALTEKKTDCDQ